MINIYQLYFSNLVYYCLTPNVKYFKLSNIYIINIRNLYNINRNNNKELILNVYLKY